MSRARQGKERVLLRKAVGRTYRSMGMDRMVIFRTFDLAEAQVIRGRLEGAGLEPVVEHENSATNFDVAGGGVRVTVPTEQAEDARALIQSRSNE